jgi:hypothetical protein
MSCQSRADALRVQKAPCQRLRKFGLTLEPTQDQARRIWSLCAATCQQAWPEPPTDDLFLGLHAVLHSQPEGQLSGWTAYGKVTIATVADALTGPNAADAALVDPRTGGHPQSNAPRPPFVLRHCREHPGIATGPSGRRTLLAHHAQQSELEGYSLVDPLPTDQAAVSHSATKAVSPLLGVASYRRAVKHLLTSVAREICTLRSVGAGARATSSLPRQQSGRLSALRLAGQK